MRKKVHVSKVHDKECPVCRRYRRDSWVKVAQHIAMKKDRVHREWRIENNLPGDYRSMREVRQMIIKIMRIFGWKD